jgi:hypothetical protein
MTRPDTPNILAITFLYYKDLARPRPSIAT